MKGGMRVLVNSFLGILTLACGSLLAQQRDYEVWVIDQSDTAMDGGGTLHIYSGAALSGPNVAQATPDVIDLGGAARRLCGEQTGTAPQRPHMILFNAANSHAIISFVASGHVLFMDAVGRKPVACLDAGAQAHAAVPSSDQRHVVVANQNGKLLQRISTDYRASRFTLDEAATLNLAACTTPSGARCEDPALRPDNAPICPIMDDRGLVFTTLRGGGLLVVDSKATPMSIVGEFDLATVHPNGCGGVSADGKMYLNSGGGTPANPLESDLYALALAGFSSNATAPNTPAPKVVFSHDERDFVDSHGATLAGGQRYLWVGDRAANRIVVVDTQQDTVVNEIALAGALSQDPAPDLMDVSPDGSRVFVALRGPNPLTANAAAANNAVGSTPGLAVLRVEENGRTGTLEALLRITRLVDGTERADLHGLRVRMR
jgi:DNA-binding beta-propeller fold protein YncE